MIKLMIENRRELSMKTQGYTAFIDRTAGLNNGLNTCSKESNERPLMLNSSGNFMTTKKFTTNNTIGRLDYYLMYIAEGELAVKFPCGDITLTAGSLLLIPPRTPYKYALKEGKLNYLWAHFTGSHAESILRDCGFKLYPEYNILKPDNSILTRFRNLFDAFSKNDRFRDRELSLLFERLLISIARRLDSMENEIPRSLTCSLGYINTHYNQDIRIPFLAQMESISVSRYNTVFRSIMGVSPTEHITNLRISSACELLADTNLSIKEIGNMVGYSDQHFFSKTFKSKMGISPSAYRNGE